MVCCVVANYICLDICFWFNWKLHYVYLWNYIQWKILCLTFYAQFFNLFAVNNLVDTCYNCFSVLEKIVSKVLRIFTQKTCFKILNLFLSLQIVYSRSKFKTNCWKQFKFSKVVTNLISDKNSRMCVQYLENNSKIWSITSDIRQFL